MRASLDCLPPLKCFPSCSLSVKRTHAHAHIRTSRGPEAAAAAAAASPPVCLTTTAVLQSVKPRIPLWAYQVEKNRKKKKVEGSYHTQTIIGYRWRTLLKAIFCSSFLRGFNAHLKGNTWPFINKRPTLSSVSRYRHSLQHPEVCWHKRKPGTATGAPLNPFFCKRRVWTSQQSEERRLIPPFVHERPVKTMLTPGSKTQALRRLKG